MLPFLIPLLAGSAPAPAVQPAQPVPLVQRATSEQAPTSRNTSPTPRNNTGPTPNPDLFGGMMGRAISWGNSPADWGRSRACAKMRRQNKLRRAGIGGQKI